jgi:CHASE2 domain-containing sensor protein
MKKSLLRGFSVTLFVFVMLWGIDKLSDFKLFTAFDPIGVALAEFELTDYVFSNLREPPPIEDKIVIVNIGQSSRMQIAQYIQTISQYKPRVIGVDSFFNCEGGFYNTEDCPQLTDTLGNLMLSNAIQEAGNVVLVSRLLQTKKLAVKFDSLADLGILDVYDSMEYSDPMFSDYAHNAFANLPTGDRDNPANAATYQEDVKICKSLIPKVMVKGDERYPFSVMMAMVYDSIKTRRFLDRDNDEELINFRGNIAISSVKIEALRQKMAETSNFRMLCYALDWDQLEAGEFDSTMFQDKIVILGYLGDYLGDSAWEDKFFTPLNAKVAGRANPDMFGPVIHANAVAMILNEDFIDETPLSVEVITAVVICFLNVLLFYWIDEKFPALFDGLSVVLQIVQLIIVSLIIVYAFAYYNYKLEFSLTLAVLALIGPAFDIYKSIENTLIVSLTNRFRGVLTTRKAEIS